MIKYDYVLERDEGDEVRIYRPDKIPNELPDLVYIEGPNSSGKSTLLHIVALGLHGLKLKNIKWNPALRNRMEGLLKSKHQRLEFKFRIANEDQGLELRSSKPDPGKTEIVVHEISNGKKRILTPEKLESKYNLIYDIPHDPTDRLNQLTYSIKSIQQTYGNRIGSLRSHIHSVITDIRNSRDPKRIGEFRKRLAALEEEHGELQKEIGFDREDLDMLERLAYSQAFSHHLNELVICEEKLRSLRKEKKRKKRDERRMTKELEALRVLIQEMRVYFHDLTPLLRNLAPRKEKHLLEIWERTDLNDAMRNLEFTGNLKGTILSFKGILHNLMDDEGIQTSLARAEFFQRLIELLDEYRTSDVKIPGLDKTIPDFISVLMESNKENEQLLRLSENVEKAIELLGELDRCRESAEDFLFPKLRELVGDELDDSDGFTREFIIEEIEELERELRDIKKKCEHYRTQCAKKEISESELNDVLFEFRNNDDLEPYFLYTEEQLEEKIGDTKAATLENEKDLSTKEHRMRVLHRDIERLEKMEPHEYQTYQKDLEELLGQCQLLEQRLLTQYNSYISDIIEKKKPSPKSKGPEQSRYNDAIAKYLGQKIGFVSHIDNDFSVKTIDLIKGEIHTNEGKVIRLTDMGTGQSQSAYLRTRLATADDRKIIALFDEVAMMDARSLKPIFDQLKKLRDEGRLLCGIVVQMADDVKVRSMVDG